MKSFIRLALILAGVAAIVAGLSTQPAGGPVVAPPAPAAASTNGRGPRIQFNTENYNAGTNFPGDLIRYTFVATNTGDDTLEISSATGACSCTVVGEGSSRGAWTLQKIAPGQTCRIPVEVATASLRGQIIKTVTVACNDPARPSVVLQISGVVWLPIEVAPEAAVFNCRSDTTNLTSQVLRIFNRMDKPLTLSNPRSNTNAFSAVLKTNVPGQEFELTVSAAPPTHLPPSTSVTVVHGEISLESSATNRNPLTISVVETVAPEITVFPTNIQLPAGPLAQPSRSLVTIRGNNADLTVSDPGVNAPGVGVALTMMQTNRTYVVSVVFPRGFEARSARNVALTVKTDNPRYPAISVPVTALPGLAVPAPPQTASPPLRTSGRLTPASPPSELAAPLPPPSTALRDNAARP